MAQANGARNGARAPVLEATTAASTSALANPSRPALRLGQHSFIATQPGVEPPHPPESRKQVKPTPPMYWLIRLLFKFVLKVFYASIVVENTHYIPPSGYPTILVANHGNSLTDPLILVTSVSLRKRSFLRLTAKDTLFGRKTFTSWLIESVGTLPIQRHREHATGTGPNNAAVMEKLVQAVGEGDAICLFPEGGSRYHPTVNSFKTGTARIVSDILSRNRDDPNFELTLLSCSLTYTSRERFRSDVLVSFSPPFKLKVREHAALIGTPDQPADFGAIRALTDAMGEQIRQGTLDSPSWEVLNLAGVARRLYAPLGTRMGLGDHTRLTQAFVDVFAKGEARKFAKSQQTANGSGSSSSTTPGFIRNGATSASDLDSDNEGVFIDQAGNEFSVKRVFTSPPPTGTATSSIQAQGGFFVAEQASQEDEEAEDLEQLKKDLKAYDDKLRMYGIKDERVRQSDRLTRAVIIKRLVVRLAGMAFLGGLAAPGMVLWQPVFWATEFAVAKVKKSGPSWDTHDEISQIKLITGLGAFLATWFFLILLTLPISFLTFFLVPLWMWLSLRWWEDAASCVRAAVSLFRLLVWVGKPELTRRRIRKSTLWRRRGEGRSGKREG